MEIKDCSRRQFFTGAAAVATAGLLGPKTAEAEELSSQAHCLPTKWHRSSDVIVVGFGAAGAAAAYEAAAAGASVTLVDTSASGGGDTAISGGYVFIGGGTALQQAAGYQETPEQMFALVRAMGGPDADPDIIRVWCEQGPELFQWLSTRIGIPYDSSGLVFAGMEQHAEFRAIAPNGIPVPHSHAIKGAALFQGGKPLFEKLSAAALASGRVRFVGQTKVTRLVQDPLSHRILGVAAQAVDGSGMPIAGAPVQFIRATRGVIIATGSFSANADMRARHSSNLMRFSHWSQANADGSGIRIAQKVGADLRLMKVFWALVMFAADPTTVKGIMVSPAGTRFVAEDEGFTWLAHHMVNEQPTAYVIYDSAILGGGTPDPNAFVGNSIEELVQAINARDGVGMAPELLSATLLGYNQLANSDGVSGVDPAFLKDPSCVIPIETPPYYAVKHTAMEALGTTGGGLRVNTSAEVLDPDGKPILGLYAAGTCASLTLSERYTGGGTAIAGALIFGRIAGQRAARH